MKAAASRQTNLNCLSWHERTSNFSESPRNNGVAVMTESDNKRRIIHVGIAEMAIVRAPEIVKTTGLGSCVAVILFDRNCGLAGLAHIMLPDSKMARSGRVNSAKYADTAIKELIAQLTSKGARMQHFQAKIAGGAQMFKLPEQENLLKIGQKNIDAVRNHLSLFNIPIVAEDVGGKSSRSVEFDTQSMVLTVKTVQKGIKKL